MSRAAPSSISSTYTHMPSQPRRTISVQTIMRAKVTSSIKTPHANTITRLALVCAESSTMACRVEYNGLDQSLAVHKLTYGFFGQLLVQLVAVPRLVVQSSRLVSPRNRQQRPAALYKAQKQ
jgi:hypothetical protein